MRLHDQRKSRMCHERTYNAMKGTEFVNRRNVALNLYKYYCTCHFGIDCRSFRGGAPGHRHLMLMHEVKLTMVVLRDAFDIYVMKDCICRGIEQDDPHR